MYVPQLSYPFVCYWTSRLLHDLATVNSAAMNIGLHVSLSILVSSVCMPRSGIKCSGLVHWEDPEDSGGEGGGRGDRDGEYM